MRGGAGPGDPRARGPLTEAAVVPNTPGASSAAPPGADVQPDL